MIATYPPESARKRPGSGASPARRLQHALKADVNGEASVRGHVARPRWVMAHAETGPVDSPVLESTHREEWSVVRRRERWVSLIRLHTPRNRSTLPRCKPTARS